MSLCIKSPLYCTQIPFLYGINNTLDDSWLEWHLVWPNEPDAILVSGNVVSMILILCMQYKKYRIPFLLLYKKPLEGNKLIYKHVTNSHFPLWSYGINLPFLHTGMIKSRKNWYDSRFHAMTIHYISDLYNIPIKINLAR